MRKKKHICIIILIILILVIIIYLISNNNFDNEIEKLNNNNVYLNEINSINNIQEENTINNNANEGPQDITEEISKDEFTYYNGIIYNIDDNYIYFSEDNSKQYYFSKNSFSYKNGRTAKDMKISDVKIGDYLNNYEKQIIIYRNISGDELNQELIYNLTLTDDERIMMVNSVEIENISVTGNNSAIVKVKYGDIIGTKLTNETFETMVEFNSNTKFYSKGDNINYVNDLEKAKYNINSIILDRNSINKKNPAIVITFDSSDT